MAESDRHRLLARALALPEAEAGDFFGGRRAPEEADGGLIKRIDDTSLRTKLIDAGLAEGLQSPKGPQKIASIVRIYPAFDAPRRAPSNGRSKAPAARAAQPRGLPTVEEMERLIARIREVESSVAGELALATDAEIERLKRALADLGGDELEKAYRELGKALEQKRALAAQIRFETFRRIERDPEFAQRAHLRLLRH